MTAIDPMSEVEILSAMRNIARMARAFYIQLLDEGFTEQDALMLTARYVHGVAGGKTS